MLMIRLQRIGKTKQPSYRLIVSEKSRDTQGKSLEILGNFQPLLKENQVNFNIERIKHWLSKGAQASETVHNLLVKTGVINAPKRRVVHISKARLDRKLKT